MSEGADRSVGHHDDVQEVSLKSGAGEQYGPGTGSVRAGEVTEGAVGFLDDGGQWGGVPGAGRQEEQTVQLACRVTRRAPWRETTRTSYSSGPGSTSWTCSL